MTSETLERFESSSRYDGFSWKPRADTIRLLEQAKEILEDSPRVDAQLVRLQQGARRLLHRLSEDGSL
jgi:hypothetical protein